MSMPKNVLVLGALPEHMAQTLDKLQREGVRVRQIEGPYRLIAAFADEPADVLVLDLVDLRQKDLEILKVVREIQPNVGVICLTDRDQRDLAGNALCGGADLYLLRPINGPEFLAALDRAAARKELAEVRAKAPAVGPSDAIYKLAKGVAHEINNPLTTISGWLQVLTADHADNEQLAGVMGSMKEEVDRVADVVRQLLVFAQQGPPRSGPVDLPELLAELERVHQPKLQEKGAELVLTVHDEIPTASGDAKQLRQAFDTIVTDAEAVLDSNDRIEITCRARRGGVELVFHDNGPVMSQSVLERVFDPFHDGRNGTTSGMGLSLAHGIICSHGGDIEVASSESDGTRFTVWLPAHNRQPEAQ